METETKTKKPSVPFQYPQEAVLIRAADIDIGDRARADLGAIEELATDIMTLGLIHPPTLTKKGNKLIAGGRRTAAITGPLGCEYVPVVFREAMPQHKLKELELHENISRLEMKWAERCLLIDDIHRLKVKAAQDLGQKWYAKQTGELMGRSAAHVSHVFVVAKALRAGDEEIMKCKNFTDALKILLARKADEAVVFKAKQSGVILPTKPQVAPPKVERTGVVEVNLDEFTESSALKPSTPVPAAKKDPIVFDLANFRHGDCLEVMKSLPSESVDHIITDPPYGIDMSNLDTYNDIERIESTHTVEGNLALFKPFIEESFRLIKNGFLIFWYDLDHHNLLQQLATDAGFKVCRWPITWCKTHTCRNSAAQYNPTKATEVAMVCRKGEAVMQKPMTKNYILADGLTERKMFDHPFIKPFEVWKFICDHFTYTGQHVLDPFGGRMSGPRAFINCGLKVSAIEVDPLIYIKGVQDVQSLVKEVTGNNVTFTNDITAEVAKLVNVSEPPTYVDPDTGEETEDDGILF